MRLTGFLGLASVGVLALEFLLSMPLVAGALMSPLQPFPALSRDDIERETEGRRCAIVVLAAGRRTDAPEYGHETLDRLSLERLRYGARLARETGLPILLSGGGARAPSLASLMANVLTEDYGLQARWLEEKSRTTAENAILSAAILRLAGIRCVVLVTHAWHMPRARAAFIGNDMTVIPSPTALYRPPLQPWWVGLTPNTKALCMIGYGLHEAVGRVWYSLRYGYP